MLRVCVYFYCYFIFGIFSLIFQPEGAENFKKVATDKRSLADVTAMVKKANNKLQELQVNRREAVIGFLNDMAMQAVPLG